MSNTRRSERAGNNPVRKGRGASQQKRSGNQWIWAVAGVVVVLVVILLATRLFGGSSNGDITGVQTFSGLSRDHTNDKVTYPQTPPVGGAHNPVWQNCGVYSQPVQNEHAVHSLEHGAVWITYQPDLPAGEVQKLRALVQNRSYTLLSPYPGLPKPVVASAWGLQLQLDSADDARLAQFIARYAQGPQTPEPGAACSGGIATAAGQ
ncbi:MAG TPA: DUF3105 domain-containing protein [Roseiflexaceae bacterium]|nr:DUF3105 domain-containing protein [Roseiflexaceae bacterium]